MRRVGLASILRRNVAMAGSDLLPPIFPDLPPCDHPGRDHPHDPPCSDRVVGKAWRL